MAPLSSLTALVERTTKEVKSPRVRGLAKQIATDPALNEGVVAMMERHTEMRSPLTALLAGIAADPKARRMWEDELDAMWAEDSLVVSSGSKKTTIPEVFVGGGLSAATFCATRVANGEKPPLVLEMDERVGGAFAVSRTPSFYLNSRNRPGGLGIPGSEGSLNYIPHAHVQPSELGFEEYQNNADVAFAIRAVFALTGTRVIPKTSVRNLRIVEGKTTYSRGTATRNFSVEVAASAGTFLSPRVIVGTGIGQPKDQWYAKKLLSFKEFMRSLDDPFPFRDMGRVAVIGAGDSGKVVIEALTGQGPARHMSVAALDFPRDIVWYGQTAVTRQDFESCNRARYRKLGTLFGRSEFREQRVKPLNRRVEMVEDGFDCVLVDGQPFDLAIDCTGPTTSTYACGVQVTDQQSWLSENEYDTYGRYVSDDYFGEAMIFFVGPAARLSRTPAEMRAVPDAATAAAQRELLVAAWRYTGRTAMLAESI